jgi:hypothetical protein
MAEGSRKHRAQHKPSDYDTPEALLPGSVSDAHRGGAVLYTLYSATYIERIGSKKQLLHPA